MPSTDSSRVKTSGRGEIEYANSDGTTSLPFDETAAGYVDPASHPHVLSVTGENVGTGIGLFAGSNGADHVVLDFKTVNAGAGIVITDDGNSITIRATGSGGGGECPCPPDGSDIEDGFDLKLGDVAQKGDGSWEPGAVQLEDDMSVSDAVDSINEVLGKLIPAQPPRFPNGALSVSNAVGSSPLLAVGFNNNATGGSFVAGSPVTRITDAGVNSNAFNDVGPGETGKITLNIDGLVVGEVTLTGENDNGTYNGLRIADQKDFPVSTPGFWKSIDVSVQGASVPIGLNKMQLAHSAGGQTSEVFFVRDDLTATPAITNVVVTEVARGTPRFSSGIPHYATGGKLRVASSMSNFSGQTYYGGNDPLVIASGGASVITSQAFGYSAIGVSTPIAINTLVATPLQPVDIDVNGNVHGFGWVTAQGKNVNGGGANAIELTGTPPTTQYTPFQINQTKVLVMRGVSGAKVDELSIPVTGLGSLPNAQAATRVKLTAVDDRPAGAVTAWDSTASLGANDASVVAGVIIHDQTDYSKSFLPAGPNYSIGRSGAQYLTVEFARSSVSTFKINVTGTYGGCWVRLPGVTDNASISPNAIGGWLDASKAYDGAGVPGEAGDVAAGCAQGAVMNGTSGAYTITFGPQTSTNANGNNIQVRFRLNAGQSITALGFSN